MYWFKSNIFQIAVAVCCCVCTIYSFPDQRWRLDRHYEPWTMEGSFILGTPPECPPTRTPHNGRWVCSFNDDPNERSLCMVDCMKGYIIKQHPQIYSCQTGRWKEFPIERDPDFHNLVPAGDCIVDPRANYRQKRYF